MCTIHIMIIALLALLPFILINLLFFLVVFANVWTSHWVCSNIEPRKSFDILALYKSDYYYYYY